MEDGGFGHDGKRSVYVVTGPPGSGKTTWVRQRAKSGDLVWDVDAVASAVFGIPAYPRPVAIAEALAAMRNAVMRMLPQLTGDAYIIETDEGSAVRMATSLGGNVVRMRCDEADRVERIEDRKRGHHVVNG